MRSSLLNPTDQYSPELPRLSCAFHPQEQLTNFCKSKECLLPLCPICVNIHVTEHMNSKTHPQLEHINDSIRDLHNNLDAYTLQLNSLYKHLVHAQGKVEEFRETLKGHLISTKQNLIEIIQDHFKRMETTSLKQVEELQYVKTLGKYKQLSKKMILCLKNTQRNFFAEESKVTRMIIKFESNRIRQHLDSFCKDAQQLVLSTPPLSFVLDDHPLSLDFLKDVLKVNLKDFSSVQNPKDVTNLIKQLYQKPCEKKGGKKCLQKLASYKNTPTKTFNQNSQQQNYKKYETLEPVTIKDFSEIVTGHQGISSSHVRTELNEITEYQFIKPENSHSYASHSYSSVKDSIEKATKNFNQTITRNSRIQNSIDPSRGRRQSLSRGKGITLIQQTSTIQNQGCRKGIFRGDLDLSLINSKTQKIPRRYR